MCGIFLVSIIKCPAEISIPIHMETTIMMGKKKKRKKRYVEPKASFARVLLMETTVYNVIQSYNLRLQKTQKFTYSEKTNGISSRRSFF